MSTENSELNNKSFSFEESDFSIKSRSVLGKPQVPAMFRFMVDKGLVKNSEQARIVLFVLVIILLILSGFFMFKSTTVPPAFPDSKTNNVNNSK